LGVTKIAGQVRSFGDMDITGTTTASAEAV